MKKAEKFGSENCKKGAINKFTSMMMVYADKQISGLGFFTMPNIKVRAVNTEQKMFKSVSSYEASKKKISEA